MTRKTAAIAIVVALALVAAAVAVSAGQAQVREVSMPGKAFAPDRLQVLVGDTVVWRNADSATHTVTASDDAFDSGRLPPGSAFTQVFARPGRHRYNCTIHRFMRGEVLVVPVALNAPETPVASGSAAALNGIAPDGVTEVFVEQIAPVGPTRRVVPAVDGTFSVTVRMFVPTAFRARAGTASTPPVRVRVSPRVVARTGAGRVVASVAPPRPGARALLQEYDRERFAWRTIRRATVSGARVSLPLAAGARGHFRIVVRGSAGWADGASRAVKVG